MTDPIVKPRSKKVNLVISGTGALYPAHAGAVCALMDLGYSFKAVSATSGGALIASALCAGIPKETLRRVIINFNPWKVLLRSPKLPITNGWGFFDNLPLVNVLKRMFGALTFAQSPIPIHIVATQLFPVFGRFVFNKESHPDMTLAEACRVSSAVPVLFRVVSLDGMQFIDGSFSDDLPISTFANEYENTIALNIQINSIVKPVTFWQFIRFCLSMIINDQGQWKFTPAKLTTIPIEIDHYTSPLQFNLTRADRKRLFELGYQAVMQYFK